MSDEKIVEVEIERLITFKNHPFKVGDDKEMSLLKDSIEKYGILNPIIVRPTSDGVYEIISGHRRKHAAEMLGHRKVPVIIRVLDDNESVIQIEVIVVDNVKRVTKEAFEKWYEGQTRYRTREDKQKDRAVENASISMPDMARLLGVERSEVYRILSGKEYGHLFEVFTLADRKRITKKSFEDFLDIQNEYKLINAKYYKSIRKKNYKSRKKKKVKDRISDLVGDREYLTVEEASLIANMSRSSISRYYREGVFTALKIGPKVRIKRDSFEKWITEKEKEEKGK